MIQRLVTVASLIFCTLIVVLFTSCSSTKKKSEDSSPVGYVPESFEQVTQVGSNSQPKLSRDGKKLVFVSEKRLRHANPQVYEMLVETRSERRVTFSDGETHAPVLSPNQRIIFYASTTDEEKENASFFHSSAVNLPSDQKNSGREVASPAPTFGFLGRRFELYVSELNGSSIRRLTQNRGFDSDLDHHPKRNALVYSSLREGQTDLLSMDPSTGRSLRLTQSPDFEFQPRYSPDGLSLSWVQGRSPFTETHVFVGNPRNTRTIVQLTKHAALHLSPSWHPNGQEIVFSSNLKGDNFELYVVKADGSCLRRLTYVKSDETEPTFSPDGQHLYFTSTKSSEKQIYRMKYNPPATCPEG